MSPQMKLKVAGIVCFPRVSGDEPERHNMANRKWMFSPRERG